MKVISRVLTILAISISMTYAVPTAPPPPISVPEPGTLLLVGLGLAALLFSRYHKK